MKKIILKICFLFFVQVLFSNSNTYYNKNLKNAKNFNIDIMNVEVKLTEENYEYLKNLGIIESFLFNYFTEIDFEEGTLLIFWKYQQEYISNGFFKNIKYISDSRPGLRLYFKNSGDTKYTRAINKNYFKVEERTEKAEVFNLKAVKRSIQNDNIFKECVDIYQIVSFLNKNICIILSCYIFPFKTWKEDGYNKAVTSDNIIEIFGLPDLVESYYFKWPDKETKNGIYYSPDVKYSESGEHWRYNKYPDLVIDISSGKKVRTFGTDRNQDFYKKVKIK